MATPATSASSAGPLRRFWVDHVVRRFGVVDPPPNTPNLFQYRDDEAIERPFNWAQMRRLLSYMRPYTSLALLATATTVAGTVMQLARPYLLMLITDDILARHGAAFEWLVGLYLLSYVVTWLSNVFQTTLTARVGQSVIRDLRRHLYGHIQNLSLSFFDSRPAGNILVRVTNDVNALSDLFTNGVVTVITNTFMIIGIVVLMLALQWNLALACFAVLPFLWALSAGLRREIRFGWQRVRRRLSRLNAHLNEAIQGMRVTQAFVREETNAGFFWGINYAYYRTWMDTQRSSALFGPLVNVAGAIGTAVVFWYGAELLQHGAVTVGLLIAFSQYVSLFWQPISLLGNFYNSLLQAMASSERIFQFLDFQPTVRDAPTVKPLPKVRGEVVFDDVSFAYPGGRQALSHVSFSVKPGQTVALVGHTGAGKTTIVGLLARFYDPTEGAIRIDGHDLRSVSLMSLRSQIGMVLQETFLFSGTIASNLRYGKLDAAWAEVEQAAREAGLDDYLRYLPKGYETEVEERGSRLSAGQRQLLAIGRALLADPRILILDEATSSIDTHTELLVQAALHRLLKGRTAFVVAHRLSTIEQADLILVLDHGRIVERGTHQSLLEAGGVYADLLKAQFRFLELVGGLEAAR
jgi:ATP-binding cassette subfamily B multidrug efflux pump